MLSSWIKSAARSVFACLILVTFPWSSVASAQQATPAAPSPAAVAPNSSLAPAYHEDFNSLTLEGSALPMKPPILGQKDDVPTQFFTRERYMMEWRPGDPFDLYVIRPRGVANPPVVIYLYSFPQDSERYTNDRWCETATRDGYAAVGFVSANTGHRIRGGAANQWFVTRLQESLAETTHDVQMILNYLNSRGDFDMHHVGMFGQGSGATVAILAAAADPRIQVLDAISPWGDWPTWMAKSSLVPANERPAYLKPEFLAKVAPLDPALMLPKVRAKSVLLQDVREYFVVPNECQEKIEAAAPENAEIKQFGDARAFFQETAAGSNLFEWVKNQLRPDAKVAVVGDKSQRVHYFAPAGGKIE
jgi:dienelactone hydrolase